MMSRRLFPGDVVRLKAETGSWVRQAIVERTHDDIESHASILAGSGARSFERDSDVSSAAFKRFMKEGIPPKDTVLLQWESTQSMILVSVSKLELIDRPTDIGEVVKRNDADVTSGVVIRTSTTCSLQPIYDVSYKNGPPLKALLISGQADPAEDSIRIIEETKPSIITNVPVEEVVRVDELLDTDIVIYGDWVGLAEAVSSKIQLKLSDNCVVEVDDHVGTQIGGEQGYPCVGDIITARKGELRMGTWIYGRYNPNTPPVGTVVKTRIIGAEMRWLSQRIGAAGYHEPHPVLERTELESPKYQIYDRTRRPKSRVASSPATDLISDPEIDLTLATRVRFRDIQAARTKYTTPSNPDGFPIHERRNNMGYDLNIFDVICTKTTATVQWQDLSTSTYDSVDLIPATIYDDKHAAWPAEVVHTLKKEPVSGLSNIQAPTSVGIVQSVDGGQRTAKVRWSEKSYAHFSVDPARSDDNGQLVEFKIVSDLGPEQECSLYDIEVREELNTGRGDIVLLRSAQFSPNNSTEPNDVRWLGQVVGKLSDGRQVVRLGAAKDVEDVVVSREECIVIHKAGDDGEEAQWDEQGFDDGFSDEDDLAMDGYDYTSDEFDSTIDSEDEANATFTNEFGDPMNLSEVDDEEWESDNENDDDGDVRMTDDRSDELLYAESNVPVTSSNPNGQETSSGGIPHDASSSQSPARYVVSDAPVSLTHHFRDQPSTSNQKHIKRTFKEHKILQADAALPDGVYVLTWESRLDLIRVLILGPTETPYTHAPFVIDLYLPVEFPVQPPQAFFHSWPSTEQGGSSGRLGPNLYEDGRVCLSLLGTWEGNKSEGWNASRSTVLQIIVSILGLVLVREPYYCEAGYESLIGTEATKVPSAVYSERVFLRSRGCTVAALRSLSKQPLTGLDGMESVIKWLYLDRNGPRLLDAIIEDTRGVLSRSRAGNVVDGVTTLSKGACIALERLLNGMEEVKSIA